MSGVLGRRCSLATPSHLIAAEEDQLYHAMIALEGEQGKQMALTPTSEQGKSLKVNCCLFSALRTYAGDFWDYAVLGL